MKMQIYWEVVRFLVCFCLVGFAAAAKCVPEICGSTNVSYPFWVRNLDCGQPGFQIKCKEDNSTGEFALFLSASVEDNNSGFKETDFKIMRIDYTGYLVIDSVSLKAESCSPAKNEIKLFQLPDEGPFTISMSNRLVVVGCHKFGAYGYGESGEGRCESNPASQSDPSYCNNSCCCETGLEDNQKWINFTGGSLPPPPNSNDGEECGFSTIFDPSTVMGDDMSKGYYGLSLSWGIGLQNCSTASTTANYSCAINAECKDSPTKIGHVCECLSGYQGNGYSNGTSCTGFGNCAMPNYICPNSTAECIHSHEGEGEENEEHICKCFPGYEGKYYSNGTNCTDIDECSDASKNNCAPPPKGICHNIPGNYSCSCAKGYKGNGFECESKDYLIPAAIGSVSSFVVVSLGACVLFWWLRRRRLQYERDLYFQQNGGIQLQEYISSMGGKNCLRIFSEKELEIASNNYSTELGRGGFATVYKGVLLDGTRVAIKKPKAISGEFINEIMIFSCINHRNVVRLLGCCLQTQYPLLVYEFVPNGTLFEHLHSEEKHLPWETRRQIAIEAADAIAYMHFQASQPIFHRDIKSPNILLDDTFTPKVSDFGISRLRPSDEMHLSTMAMGTRGYLDPEFVQTNQYTDKSDVFSFGVVLVELLTGLTPLLTLRGTVRTLYDYFLSKMNQKRLSEILDPKVVNEVNQAQMENMARLAQACLQEETKARPSMREVVEELAWIRAATKQSGLYRDVSFVEHKSDSKKTKVNDYPWKLGVGESTSEDPYNSMPTTSDIIASDDPSTGLMRIEMSGIRGR